jgi:flagellar basal-body rod protein FlgC
MSSDLNKSMQISAAGMKAQGMRLRVIAENMANAGTSPATATEDPYRRKVISFKSELDRSTGAKMVGVKKIDTDRSAFGKKLDPGHPSADANGYVQTSNVNSLIEVMDMREAQRSYEANLGVVEVSKTMLLRTIDMLR